MQQRLSKLRVAHFLDANEMIQELRTLDPSIIFKRVQKIESAILCVLSDTSHPKDKYFGHTGLLIVDMWLFEEEL